MAELHVLVLVRHAQHVRVEIAKAGGEHEGSSIELDHALHGLLDIGGFRHFLLFDNFHAGHLLEHGGGFGVGLIVAEIVARPDIDEADNEIFCGCRARQADCHGGTGAGEALEQMAALEVKGRGHGHPQHG